MIKITLNKIPKTAKLTKSDIVSIVNESLSVFNIDKQIVEILFVDKSAIHKLNLEHRKIDKPTDVLSFPQTPINSSRYSILGSIVINMDLVIEKEEDIVEVIKHGLLHILGYDHETNEPTWNIAAKKINCTL